MPIAFNTGYTDSSLASSWVFDPAAAVHVCNNRELFTEFTECDDSLCTGDASTPIKGKGTTMLYCVDPTTNQPRTILLQNTYYSPNHHANLVSYSRTKLRGCQWDKANDCLRANTGNPIACLTHHPDRGLWIFSQLKGMRSKIGPHYAMATRKSARPRISEASLDVWHRRMAHMHPDTVKKAVEMVDGVKIKDSEDHQDPQSLCSTCNLAYAPRQVSRRGIGRTFGRFGQIYYDLINMSPAYNGH